MQIFRNNISIKLELDEFLSILESETFEQLLSLIIELDEASPPPAPKLNPAFLDTAKAKAIKEIDELIEDIDEIEREEYIVEDMDEIMEIFADIFAGGGDFEVEVYEIDLDDIEYGQSLDGLGSMFYDTMRDYDLSNEDKKVRRILNRYKDLVE